mmetsp:Transcript_48449/g.139325  ORF Transcript_48449/g.139325 Transcript_48449/m.139325 type:complete len:223 (+) Transcript_48449:1784-2452(+)
MRAVDQHLLRVIVDDVQRTSTPSAVGGYSKLEVLEVELDGHLRVDILPPPQGLQRVAKLRRLHVHPDPAAVEENLGVVLDMDRRALHEIENTPLLEEVLDHRLRRAQRDVTHQRDVLHQAHRLALGRLRGAHKAPVGVVQLPRLHQLTRPRQRGDHPPQVAERRHEGQPVQPLRNSRPHWLARLVLAPIASGKLILHPHAQGRHSLQCVGDVWLLALVHYLL